MDNTDQFYVITEPATGAYKDRGSRFLAYAFPLSQTQDFKPIFDQIKAEHPKARHHCFAYRLGFDGLNYRASDDGEPSGTAGRPILGQLDRRHLTDTLVIVVRYFGGSLLGVPGLIHAYQTAAADALDRATMEQRWPEEPLILHCPYGQLSWLENALSQREARIIDKQFTDQVQIKVAVRKEQVEAFLSFLSELRFVAFERITHPSSHES